VNIPPEAILLAVVVVVVFLVVGWMSKDVEG
jgi:hypothetical protein